MEPTQPERDNPTGKQKRKRPPKKRPFIIATEEYEKGMA